MQALLLKKYMELELVDMPAPEIGPEDVLVRVRACGICGSDVHGLDGSTGRRLPPIVMGHEAAGEVVATGANVKDLGPGDRVTFDSTIYCGKCFYCLRGEVNLCDNREVLGVSPGPYRRHGAFAELVAVPRRIVYRMPDSLTYEQAAMTEAVSVALHAVLLSGFTLPAPAEKAAASVAVVVGSGMIGLLAIQGLRAAGCKRVIAVDIDDAKLDFARRLGATDAINGKSEDAVEAVRRMTSEGRGADVAIECLGANQTVQTAINSVRKGGAVTLVGNVSPTVELPLQNVVSRQVRLQGSCASSGEYPLAIDLVSKGVIKVDGLISAVAPLAEGKSWFDRLYHHEPNLMKVILRP
jgi:L-iditol 2-dehydrogenase